MDEVKVIDSSVLIEYNTYDDFKSALNKAMNQAAESFVTIGYLLKKARDTDILYNSGYKDLYEFAEGEYQLHKDQVSRFIAINDRFSVGGYGTALKDEMKNYGVAKLSELLTLPDGIIDAIPPEMTRTEIQDIKKEIKEEEKVTDIEVMFEEKKPMPDSLIGKALHQYFYEERNRFLRTIDGDKVTPESLLYSMAPSGVGSIKPRISGVGKLLVTFAGIDKDVNVVNIRNPQEKETMSVHEMYEQFVSQYNIPDFMSNAEEFMVKIFEGYYSEPFKSATNEVTDSFSKKQETIKPENKGKVEDETPESVSGTAFQDSTEKDDKITDNKGSKVEESKSETAFSDMSQDVKEETNDKTVTATHFSEGYAERVNNGIYSAYYEEYGDIVHLGSKTFLVAPTGSLTSKVTVKYKESEKEFQITYIERLNNGLSVYGIKEAK